MSAGEAASSAQNLRRERWRGELLRAFTVSIAFGPDPSCLVRLPLWSSMWESAEKVALSLEKALEADSVPDSEKPGLRDILENIRAVVEHKRSLDEF